MPVLEGLMVAVAVLSGMAGGIFFTFSNFVMPALGRLTKAHGVAAMQAINIMVINPAALGVMLGTGLVALAGAVLAAADAEGVSRWLPVVTAVVYLIGCVGVTIFGNVPLNDQLAEVEPETPEAEELWDHYLARWTLWNTARALSCAFASAAAAITLLAS